MYDSEDLRLCGLGLHDHDEDASTPCAPCPAGTYADARGTGASCIYPLLAAAITEALDSDGYALPIDELRGARPVASSGGDGMPTGHDGETPLTPFVRQLVRGMIVDVVGRLHGAHVPL